MQIELAVTVQIVHIADIQMDDPPRWQRLTPRMLYQAACWAIFNVVYQELFPTEHLKHVQLTAARKRHPDDAWYPTTQIMLTISSLWGSRNWSCLTASFMEILSGIPFSTKVKSFLWLRFESSVQYQLMEAAKQLFADSPQPPWTSTRPGTDEFFDAYEESQAYQPLLVVSNRTRSNSSLVPAYLGNTATSTATREYHRANRHLNI